MIEKLNYDPLRDDFLFSPKLLYDKIDEIIDVVNKLNGKGKMNIVDKYELTRAIAHTKLAIAYLDDRSIDADTGSTRNLLIEAMRRLMIIVRDLKEEE